MAPRAAPPAAAAHRGGKSADERWAAVHSLRMAGAGRLGQRAVTAAKRFYQAMAPTSEISKWRAFATRWWRRTQAGKGTADARRSGRHAKVSREEAYIIATQHTQGTVGRGDNKRPYCSMEEVRCPPPAGQPLPRPPRPPPLPPLSARHSAYAAALPAQAMEKNAELKKLAQERGLTAAYLKRRCKEVVPAWRLSPLPEKKAFTAEQKRERLAYAEQAVLYPMERWKSTVFLDEHTFYRRPTPLPAIHLAGQRGAARRTVKDKRKHWYPWDYPKLHFMYAVHWKLGVLGPYWISDCKGWKGAKHYTVSNHPPRPLPTCRQSSATVRPSVSSPRDGRL